MARLTEQERQWRQGFGFALAAVNRMHDRPVIVNDVMLHTDMTVAKLKAAGLDDYDLKEIRKAMK